MCAVCACVSPDESVGKYLKVPGRVFPFSFFSFFAEVQGPDGFDLMFKQREATVTFDTGQSVKWSL